MAYLGPVLTKKLGDMRVVFMACVREKKREVRGVFMTRVDEDIG